MTRRPMPTSRISDPNTCTSSRERPKISVGLAWRPAQFEDTLAVRRHPPGHASTILKSDLAKTTDTDGRTSRFHKEEMMSTAKEQILEAYEEAHAKTMRVLSAFPAEKADLRPHPRCKSARELAFTFAMERGLGTRVFNDAMATGGAPGKPPEPPEAWSDLLNTIEQAHK